MRDDFRLGGIPVLSNNAQQTEGQITSLLSGGIVSQIPFPVEAGSSPSPGGGTFTFRSEFFARVLECRRRRIAPLLELTTRCILYAGIQ